jgi:acyl-CoA-binding protein
MSEEENKLFDLGVAFVQNSKNTKLSTAEQLRFYSLYKIATNGPCKGSAPSRFKVVEYQKFSAYQKATAEGITKENAKALYISELNKKIPSWKDSAKL